MAIALTILANDTVSAVKRAKSRYGLDYTVGGIIGQNWRQPYRYSVVREAELPPVTCGQTVGPGVVCDRPSLHKGSCSE